MLARFDVIGSLTDRGTDGMAAWCSTYSTPRTARSATVMSARSPSRNSTPATCSRFFFLPVIRLSTTRMLWPRRASSSARCEPMKPAPPVTRYEAMVVSVRVVRLREAGRQLEGVLVIQLPEHLVGQADAVKLPERVIVAVVVEVLVVGLEDAPVVRVFVRLVAVLAEE